jgi:hypothetical protein
VSFLSTSEPFVLILGRRIREYSLTNLHFTRHTDNIKPNREDATSLVTRVRSEMLMKHVFAIEKACNSYISVQTLLLELLMAPRLINLLEQASFSTPFILHENNRMHCNPYRPGRLFEQNRFLLTTKHHHCRSEQAPYQSPRHPSWPSCACRRWGNLCSSK